MAKKIDRVQDAYLVARKSGRRWLVTYFGEQMGSFQINKKTVSYDAARSSSRGPDETMAKLHEARMLVERASS